MHTPKSKAEKIWTTARKHGHMMQSKGEFIQLLDLMINLGVESVLEIGVYDGCTSLAWLELGCSVVAIEKELRPKARELIGRPNYSLVEADSNDDNLVHSAFEMVHIDGGHTYEQVAQDYKHYGQLANKLIVIHDIKDNETTRKWGMAMGVPKFWNEFKQSTKQRWLEFVTDERETGGIGVIVLAR